MYKAKVFSLLLLMSAGPAAADLSIFVASVSFDDEANLDGGAGFGVRWGTSSNLIGGETSLMIARPSRELAGSDESATAIFYEARLMLNLPLGTPVKPFLGVGLGAITVTSTDLPDSENRTDVARAALSAVADTQTNRAFSYGGGARYALNEKLSLRVDLRRYSVFSVTSLIADAATDALRDQVEDEIGTDVPEGAIDELTNPGTKDKTVAHSEISIGINFSF